MISEAKNIPGNVKNSYFHFLGMTEADISGFVQVLQSADDGIDGGVDVAFVHCGQIVFKFD